MNQSPNQIKNIMLDPARKKELSAQGGRAGKGKPKTARGALKTLCDVANLEYDTIEGKKTALEIACINMAKKYPDKFAKLLLEYTEQKAAQKIELSGGVDNLGGMTDEQRDKLFELIKAGKLG